MTRFVGAAHKGSNLTGDNTNTLATMGADAWRRLTEAVTDPEHPYRNLSLATVDENGDPQVRFLVLRDVDRVQRFLEFHTDTRSPKWAELQSRPRLSVLGYDPGDRLQLRLRGTAQLFPPGSDENAFAWNKLSPWTKTTYCGGPPGDILALPEPGEIRSEPPSEAETEMGRDRFGVIAFRATMLDWFQHKRGQIRRVKFRYAGNGSLVDANWIAP